MQQPLALVVDKDPANRSLMREVLESRNLMALGASTGAETLEILRNRQVHVLFLDMDTPGASELRLLEHALKLEPAPVLVALIDGFDPKRASELLDDGALECLSKPLDPAMLALSVQRVLKQREILEEVRRLREKLQTREGYHGIVGLSRAMKRLREQVGRIAGTRGSVWFSGEVGAGKELAARSLQRLSSNPEGPFVVVDCAMVEGADWDAQWFGVDGPAGPSGLLGEASGGTIYLESITDMPPELQERLAQSITQVSRRGPSSFAGVRLVVASLREPSAAVERGELVDSLHRALAPESLHVASLRERPEDIPLLASHFLAMIREINHLPPIQLEPDALALLERYHWPENVQELRNGLEQAVILAMDGRIRPRDLPDRIREADRPVSAPHAAASAQQFRDAKRQVVERFEKTYLADLMERHNGNVTAAAMQAGMLRSALQRLLRKHGLKSAEFRRGRRQGVSQEASRSPVG